jgi:hypothetical protein
MPTPLRPGKPSPGTVSAPERRTPRSQPCSQVVSSSSYTHVPVIVENDAGKRLVVLDDEMSGFLKEKALYVEGQGDISYYILPYSTVRELSA